MDNIKLKDKVIEPHYGRNVDKAPALLQRWKNGEGYIPSEADIKLLGVRNFKNDPTIINNYWDSSTLSATKNDDIKIVLAYDNSGNHKLTDAGQFGLSLINSNENLINNGVNLDEAKRWEKLDGSGVYTLKRKGLTLDKDLTEKQAKEHPLILTKLGHKDYVDSKFARPTEEIEEIISGIFKLGKDEHSYKEMLGQYMPDVSKKGILKAWYAYGLGCRARSYAGAILDSDDGRFAFVSVGDAEKNAKGVDVDQAKIQLQNLEGILKPEQVNEIGIALNERDNLKERLLTTDQIYSVIGKYVASANEQEIKKVLDKLTKQ